MTVAIIRFGGSNCDRDADRALAHLEIDAEIVWHEDGLPEETTGIMLPGRRLPSRPARHQAPHALARPASRRV